MSDDIPAVLGALHVDEGKLRGHVDEVVRSSVEETLNGLLDAGRTTSARRSGMSDHRIGWMAELGTTSAN